jgi:hypothetical protein
MDDAALKKWQDTQSQHATPVDQDGKGIDDGDETYNLWETLGLYAFMKGS